MYPHALVDASALVDPPTVPTEDASAVLFAGPVRPLDGLLTAAGARLCGTLDQLRAEANAANPQRDRGSDGWIGDAAHAARDSQHNADARGVVTALDLDHDGLNIAHAWEHVRILVVLGKLPGMVGGHLIYNRRITTPDFRGWYAYKGDPHAGHGHAASSREPGRYDDRTPFGCFAVPAAPAVPPAAPGQRWPGPDAIGSGLGFRADDGFAGAQSNGPRVLALQTFLSRTFPLYAKHLDLDGWYGPQLAGAVREFARRSGVAGADGRNVGPQVAAALYRAGFR